MVEHPSRLSLASRGMVFVCAHTCSSRVALTHLLGEQRWDWTVSRLKEVSVKDAPFVFWDGIMKTSEI